MTLIPLTSRVDSEAAFRVFRERMTKGCQEFQKKLGHQGGFLERDVYWNASERIWSVFDAEVAAERFWCAFGTVHPKGKPMLEIAVECNPPKSGFDRRCAGAFLQAGSELLIAHSGKIGGGRKGIGKSAFRDAYPEGNWRPVQWPDGRETEMPVLGCLGDKRLPSFIAEFVRKVERFKNGVAKGIKPEASTEAGPSFTPEFAGKRRAYTLRATIQSSCDHGFVVNALQTELERRGFKGIGKDRPRDLFVEPDNGCVEFLFEAKTDLTSNSIYQAIGQLTYHSEDGGWGTKRIMVLPGSPKAETRAVLSKLGIRVLRYAMEGNGPVFKNLDEVLR